MNWMLKNYWNDPKPQYINTRFNCCSCRSSLVVSLQRYPHGPSQVKFCPICGTNEPSNLQIGLVY